MTLASAETLHSTPEFVPKECAAPMPSGRCYAAQCGRFVVDDVLSNDQLQSLRGLAADIMKLSPGGSGGPTILDLHSGRLMAVLHHMRT